MSKKIDEFINMKVPSVPMRAAGNRIRERIKSERMQMALKRRQGEIDRYRLTAIRALISCQYIRGFPRETYLESLKLLKQQRPDDKLYQDTLEAKIQEVSKSLLGSQ